MELIVLINQIRVLCNNFNVKSEHVKVDLGFEKTNLFFLLSVGVLKSLYLLEFKV